MLSVSAEKAYGQFLSGGQFKKERVMGPSPPKGRTVVGEVVGGALETAARLRRLVLAEGLVGHALSLVGDLVHDERWGGWVVVVF